MSVVTGSVVERLRQGAERIVELKNYPPHPAVSLLRGLIDLAHFRWLDSEVARETLLRRTEEAPNRLSAAKRSAVNALTRVFANRPGLRLLDTVEKSASWKLRPTDDFCELFKELKPDLVFNGSHIHGPAAEEPLRAAHQMGIPTAGFVFSWDNLTSRGRIMAPYDYFFVWNQGMKKQLLNLYSHLRPENVFAPGTPQFDFHFQDQFHLSRVELCRRIGLDPQRPIIFYTTGMNTHFPEEHRTVEFLIQALERMNLRPKPQLVVRRYVKGTSREMMDLANRNLPDVVFPDILWEEKWKTPLYEDLPIYTSLLREAALGINVASTVSLELIIHDKPVINLGFDPPGSKLGPLWEYERHLRFDHYAPVVASGAVMVARSPQDLEPMIMRGLTEPEALREERARFKESMFGSTLDGRAGSRIAEILTGIATLKSDRDEWPR
ncbi:MAG: hypothetical protein ABI811_06190 [Acidobacteriota bacterium]